MPKKIIIVRHGETDHNARRILQGHLDTVLNKKGLAQARETAELLKEENIDVIFSSDLSRALTTAQIVTQNHHKDIIQTKALRERNFGKLQGMTYEEIERIFPLFSIEQDTRVPGYASEQYAIETDEEVAKRIKEFVTIILVHKNKTVAIFAHGGSIRPLLIELGVPTDEVKAMSVKNAHPFILEKKGGKYTLISS